MVWQDAYRTVTTVFGAGGQFYDGAGHRGTDYARGAGQTVPAYEPGVIGYVALSTAGLGGVVGMKLDAGGYAGWAHLDPVLVSVGQRVKAGDTVGCAAGPGQRHGSLWDGAHIHTTLSPDSSANAALGIRPLLDPAPRIAAALTGTAGLDPSLIGEEMTKEQWEWLTLALTNIAAYLWGGGPDVTGQIGARDSIFGLIIQVQAKQAAQDAVIAQLAAGKGVDQAAVAAAVEDAVTKGIAGLRLSGTVTLAPPPAAK